MLARLLGGDEPEAGAVRRIFLGQTHKLGVRSCHPVELRRILYRHRRALCWYSLSVGTRPHKRETEYRNRTHDKTDCFKQFH